MFLRAEEGGRAALQGRVQMNQDGALAPVSRPVVKMRVTSPVERVVAGSNPAAGICARVAQR